jgi:hypothetical protein
MLSKQVKSFLLQLARRSVEVLSGIAMLLVLSVPATAEETAWTRGRFRLSYLLTETGSGARAEKVRVALRNETSLPRRPSARLREHEDAHRRINEAAARDMEARLAAFPPPQAPDRAGLKRAEAALRREFRRLVSETEKLHRAWDATHTVP